MTIIEALKLALVYEEDIRNLYQAALEKTNDPRGRRIFELMSEEEDEHVRYLQKKYEEMIAGNPIVADDLKTMLPSPEQIAAARESLGAPLLDVARESEVSMLMKAKELELKTSRFYEDLVNTLPQEGQQFFKRFVEIEQGHLALVEAEIDYLQHKGAWLAVDYGELKYR